MLTNNIGWNHHVLNVIQKEAAECQIAVTAEPQDVGYVVRLSTRD